MADAHHIPAADLRRYAVLAFPLAFAGMPLYIHAPDFYATQAGMGLAQIGAILIVLRIVDAVQDPLIGWISDRFAARRPAVILAGMAALAAGFVMLFNPPGTHVAWWFATAVLVTTTAFSVVSVNYMAIGALWSRREDQQTRVALYREGVGLTGLLLACLLPPALMTVMDADRAYSVLAAALVAAAVIAVLLVRPVLHRAAARCSGAAWPGVSALRPFAGIYAVYGLSMLASALPAVLVLFYVRDRLGMPEWTGLFLTAYFLTAAVGLPVWKKLAQRYGAVRCWLAAMGIAVAGFVWAWGLAEGDGTAFLAVCLVTGFALGAELALPPALLAGRIHETGTHAQAAGLNAGLSFLSKMAMALAAGGGLAALDCVGFRPDAVNTQEALTMLSGLYALAPCVIKLAAAALLWRTALRPQDGGSNATFSGNSVYGDRHVS